MSLEKVGHQERACLGRRLKEMNLRCEDLNGDITKWYEVHSRFQVKDQERCLLLFFGCVLFNSYFCAYSVSH